MNTVRAAKLAMKAFPASPHFSLESVGECQEVFDHELFTSATDAERRAIMLGSSISKYRSELAYPVDHYFGFDLAPDLRGKSALDLGCLSGGRGVAWLERYGLAHITGIDVRREYIEAAVQFAAVRQVPADFVVAKGERLPFADESFDVVLSFDVLEHVQDVGATLAECHRVLRPGGAFYLVFPGYYHPKEHHLSLATRTPCLHWFFSGKTLVRAYDEVLAERGKDSAWYRRSTPELGPWERCNTINGTTVGQFRRLIAETDWRVVCERRMAVGSIGRNAVRHAAAGAVSKLLSPLTSVPVVQELVIHRITYILQK